jgi:putative Holliday junction resolvase
MFDERFTTVSAERVLVAAGLAGRRRRAVRDRVAAAVLLQAYLDGGR